MKQNSVIYITFLLSLALLCTGTTFNVLKFTPKMCDEHLCHTDVDSQYEPHPSFGVFNESTRPFLMSNKLSKNNVPMIDVDAELKLEYAFDFTYRTEESSYFSYWFTPNEKINRLYQVYLSYDEYDTLSFHADKLDPFQHVEDDLPYSTLEKSINMHQWFTLYRAEVFFYTSNSSMTITYIQKDSTHPCRTNADLFLYINFILVFHCQMIVGDPIEHSIDLSALELEENRAYSVHLFIASRTITPRIVHINSNLVPLDMTPDLIPLLDASSYTIRSRVAIDGETMKFAATTSETASLLYSMSPIPSINSFTLPMLAQSSFVASFTINSHNFPPPFILGFYAQGPSFIHISDNIYTTEPSSPSLLFEFFPEDTDLFLNIKTFDNYTVTTLSSVMNRPSDEDKKLSIFYYHKYHMLAIRYNNQNIYFNDNFNLTHYISTFRASVSLYIPPNNLDTTLSITDFVLSLPSLSFDYSYVKIVKGTAFSVTEYLHLQIFLYDVTNAPFLGMDYYVFQFSVLSQKPDSADTLTYMYNVRGEDGYIDVYLRGTVYGDYDVTVLINDHSILSKSEQIVLSILPDMPSPSYSSIHFENAELHANDTIPFFYNSFVAGESVYLRIYLADQFNNYYKTNTVPINFRITHTTLGFTFNTTLLPNTHATYIEDTRYTFNNNHYAFILAFNVLQAGSYTIEGISSYLKINCTNYLEILPSTPSLSNSIFWGSLLDTAVAGRVETLIATLRDAFSNLITGHQLYLHALVQPTSNTTTTRLTSSLYKFPCNPLRNGVYRCPCNFHYAGLAQLSVYDYSLLPNPKDIESLSSKQLIYEVSTFIYPNEPICDMIVVDETIIPKINFLTPEMFRFQYFDPFRNFPVSPPAEEELVTVYWDKEVVNCFKTDIIGQYDCPITSDRVGYHTLSVKCHDRIGYQKSFVLSCDNRVVTSTIDYIVQNDTRILFSVELYDQQHNECSIPFDSFFIILTSNSTFTSSNLPLQYDIHSRKYTALFEPTQNDIYLLSLHKEGRLIENNLPFIEVNSLSPKASIPEFYVIYGDGLYGSPLYEVSSFTIILATSNFSQISLELLEEDDHHSYEFFSRISSKIDVASSTTIHSVRYVYAPKDDGYITKGTLHIIINSDNYYSLYYPLNFVSQDTCELPSIQSPERATDTGCIEFTFHTYNKYLNFEESRFYFDPPTEEEISTLLQNGQARYLLLQRYYKCYNILDYTVYTSPPTTISDFIYIGEGTYQFIIADLTIGYYYVVLYHQTYDYTLISQSQSYIYLIECNNPGLNRDSLIIYNDLETEVFYVGEESTIIFSVSPYYNTDLELTLDYLNDNVDLTIFEVTNIIHPTLTKIVDNHYIYANFTLSTSLMWNDDHISKTTILITVNSRSTYKTLLVKESHVDYTKTQITAAPGCVLYSDYCGLYVTTLSYQQQLYVYLFDAYNNPVQLETNNEIDLVFLRMYDYKYELFLFDALNFTSVDYGIYKIVVPSIRDLILGPTSYMIHYGLSSSSGVNVDKETFLSVLYQHAQMSLEYPADYLSDYSLNTIFMNRHLIKQFDTYETCDSITIDNVYFVPSDSNIVGQTTYLSFYYKDPILKMCNNVRDELYMSVISPNDYITSPYVLIYFEDGPKYMHFSSHPSTILCRAAFIPEETGLYQIQVYFKGNIERSKYFTTTVHLSTPSVYDSYFYAGTYANAKIYEKHDFYFNVVDLLNISYPLQDLNPPVQVLLWSNIEGIDTVEYLPITTVNDTHSYVSYTSFFTSSYKVYIMLPINGLYYFGVDYISVNVPVTVDYCPSVFSPNNSTHCYGTTICVKDGADCPNTCHDPMTKKCAFYNQNTNTTNFYCVTSSTPCLCSQVDLYSCLSPSQLESSQIDICTSAADQKTDCQHTDICPPSEPYLCNNYQCVSDVKYCPSSIQCPPSYIICPDNINCVTSFFDCPEPIVPSTICTDEYPLLCPDHIHCTNSISKCPSLITCPPNKYLCPNGQCVNTPYECAPLNDCPSNLFRCPLGECVNTPLDCPALPTCPNGQKLCENRQCISMENDCPDIYTEFYEAYEDDNITIYRCPSGDVVFNEHNCPDSIVCPPSQYKCPDGSCISIDEVCPTMQECPKGTIWCPSGGCAPSLFFCGTNPSCPIYTDDNITFKKTILGLDLTCHDNYTELPFISLCSKEKPIRCPNNVCVQDSSLCTTQKKCPQPTSVMCEDGSCVISVQQCRKSTIEKCPPDYFKCSSMTCAPTKELCPNTMICLPPSIYCYDGSCRTFNETQRYLDLGDSNDFSNCVSLVEKNYVFSPCTCENTNLVYCGERCVPIELCPSHQELYHQCLISNRNIIIKMCQTIFDAYPCPVKDHYTPDMIGLPISSYCHSSAPYLCPDHSCHLSINDCNLSTSCPFYQVLCNDGTCKDHYEECNNPVVCPSSKPYRCFDNICVSNPQDCNRNVICPADRPYRCYDNICTDNQQECHSLSRCSTKELMCFNYQCYDNSGYYDNELSNIYLLPVSTSTICDTLTPLTCPQGFTRCKNGACVTSVEFCEEEKCPPHTPYLCKDGSCAISQEYCREMCSSPVLCPFFDPDTQVVEYRRVCCDDTYANCCYEGNPYLPFIPMITCEKDLTLCADGICRNKENCINADGCPYESPYRCISGECVSDMSLCINRYPCPLGYYRCDNGRCVTSYLFCTTHFLSHVQCLNSYGNSDFSKSIELPILCADNTCVSTFSQCLSLRGCSEEAPYHCNSGLCVDDPSRCSPINTCPPNLPIRVQRGLYEGACISEDIYSIYESVTICVNNNPYLCENNECKLNAHQCNDLTLVCPLNTPYECPDGTCARSKSLCKNGNSCNVLTPYKCRNNDCVSKPSECLLHDLDFYHELNTTIPYKCEDGTYQDSFLKCSTTYGCPLTTPYRCYDHSCVMPTRMSTIYSCKPVLSCPYYAPYECGDGSCAVLPKHCPYIQPCRSNQVQCSDRTCADSYNECLYTTASCPVGSPIKCPDGRCVRNGSICTRKKCPDYAPYECGSGRCVSKPSECPQYPCSDNQVNCWNGLCYSSSAQCPPVPACPETKPMRCYDGQCVETPHNCSSRVAVECPLGETLCTDGICRASCSNYFGCSLNQYMCSNSTCVSMDGYDMTTAFNLSSVCTNSCIGGTCTHRYVSLYNAYYTILLTASHTRPLPVIFHNEKHVVSILIPELFMMNTTNNTVLYISGIATSIFNKKMDVIHLNNSTKETHVTLEERLLSPILFVDIRQQDSYSEESYAEPFRIPLVFYFSIGENDLGLDNMYIDSHGRSEYTSCLAARNVTEAEWKCESSVMLIENKVTGCVHHAGIFALIYQPVYTPPLPTNIAKIIMIYVIICLLVVLLLVYFIVVIILLRKYKSKCEKVNTIIKDETARKQVMLNYTYNPLLTDTKLKFSNEGDQYNNVDDHLEEDQINALQKLDVQEAKLKYAISQMIAKRKHNIRNSRKL